MINTAEQAYKKAKKQDDLKETNTKKLFKVTSEPVKNAECFLDLRNGFQYYCYKDGDTVKDTGNIPFSVRKVRSFYEARGCRTLDAFFSPSRH